MDEQQPWATCLFTDILLSHLKETAGGTDAIDYRKLFQGLEGFEVPSEPELFLRDVTNWVPLNVLRELMSQCQMLSGKGDFAYHAARAYFAPRRTPLPSLFEIIVQVLNDVRSVLICANLWGAVQANYLKLQSFERPGPTPDLYLLAQFDENANPTFHTMNFMRGICEGFPRMYPFIDDVKCTEEISQLQIEGIVREFPEFTILRRGNQLLIRRQGSDEICVEATQVYLAGEPIALSPELVRLTPDDPIVPPLRGRIEVLTKDVDAGEHRGTSVYRIVKPGQLVAGPLTYAFERDKIYNAPYSCFKFTVKENRTSKRKITADDLRKEISQLLFEHLKQIKQAHLRMIQYNVEKRRLTLENIRLRREIEREYSFAGLVGQSKQMQELFGVIRSIAETDVSVLIQGETGTGKDLIARAIHYNSQRRNRRFIPVNCGALSPTLLESELFGHEKGAFTGAIGQKKGYFESADGGTLFLDEIGEIPPSTQVKLLRILQDGELQRVGGTSTMKVNVRIIAATNKNLEELVQRGGFRQDLYYRLRVFPITVPPLRERMDDVPALVSHFIEKWSQTAKKSIKEISSPAMAHLLSYKWPGNVRELENTLQRMMVIFKGETLDVQDLPPEIRAAESESQEKAQYLKSISRESGKLVEKNAIVEALSETGGNITRAAKVLGVSRATLQNKMKLYGLRESKS